MRGLTRPVWTSCCEEEVYGESSFVSTGKRCRIRVQRAGVPVVLRSIEGLKPD